MWPHRRQPTRLPHPWDSPGKNTGVGCHFLLQCRKVKSESEVAQSCLTLYNPMDRSLPGSSLLHYILEFVQIHVHLVSYYIHTKPCTPMSLAAFFMIVKNWRQSRCSSIIEWTNHGTVDYNGLFRYKKKWSSHKKGWRELKCIFLSERRQSEKPTYCMIPAVWYSGRGKNMKTVERWLIVVLGDW